MFLSQIKITSKVIQKNLSKQIYQIFWNIEIQLLILFFLSKLLEFNKLFKFNEFIEFNKYLDDDK